MRTFVAIILALATAVSGFSTLQTRARPSTALWMATEEPSSRRALLQSAMGAVSVAVAANRVNALDMDAFMNSQLDSDTKNCDAKKDPKCMPSLSQDEALCKYGQSGDARAAACKRVRAAGGSVPTKASQGKSLGGAYAM